MHYVKIESSPCELIVINYLPTWLYLGTEYGDDLRQPWRKLPVTFSLDG